jgi:putative ABC transport system permease protein
MIRHAWRGLARRPALAVVTILTLTIGIAANAIIFGVVDQLMLEPPALIKDPGTVRRIFLREHTNGKLQGQATMPYRLFASLQPAPAFSDVAAFSSQSFTLGTGADARMISATSVSYNYFRTLGVQPALGRAFLAEEDRPPQGALVAILGDGFWHRAFGGASMALGQ